MAIGEFNPTFRPVTNPVNLDKLGQAYDTLEQGHLSTIDTASAVATELAKLDLNEEEDAWRQEQVNKIRSAVTDNTQYGNAYGALDDVIRANGQIMSDPGMIGRLRAQQDYKKYVDNLDKRNDIPEEYKAYYKEKNKYNYQDVTDDKGNIIGGKKWEPIDQEVSTVPMDQVLSKALQWAAKESGGGSQTRWLDANGKVTNDITKSVTGEFYSSSSNRWERLTKDKLAAAVTAVIENTPGAKASLEQDYKIAKWKYDKSDGNNPDIVDKDGILLTPEQYLNKKIDPFYKAATYYNQTSDVKYGEAWKAQLALARSAAGTNKANGRNPDMLTTTANPIRIENFVPSKAQAEISTSKQRLSDMIKGANPDIEFNLDGQTSEATKQLIFDNIADPVARTQAIRELEIIQDNQEYLESIKAGKNPEAAEGFDAYNAIVSMSDLPKDNKYAQQYSKAVNNIFGSDGQAVRQYFTADDTYDRFVDALGGESKLKALGINVGTRNGKRYVELPRDNNRALYSFAKATREAVAETNNVFTSTWNDIKGAINSNWGNNVVTVNSSGNEISVVGRDVQDNMINSVAYSQNRNVFGDLVDFVDNRLRSKNDEVLEGGMLQLSHNVIGQPTPNAAELAFAMKANPAEASKLSTAYKAEISEVTRVLKGVDLVQTGAYIIKDNNMLEKASTEERQALTARVRSAKENNLEIMSGQDPTTGEWGLYVTIEGKYENGDEKEAPITFFAPNAVDSGTIASWNKDTTFRAKNDINIYGGAGKNINLTDAEAFANIDKFTMRNVGGAFEVINKTNNQSLGTVSNETAVALRDAYYQWKDTYNAVKSGMNIPSERIVNMAANTAKVLAEIQGSGNNEDIISYYTDRLVNNLIDK